MSFHFITHNFISELKKKIKKCMHGLLGLLPTSGENFHVNSTFRNIFTGRNGDMFNTYFTRCNVSYRIFNSRLLKNIIYLMHIHTLPFRSLGLVFFWGGIKTNVLEYFYNLKRLFSLSILKCDLFL